MSIESFFVNVCIMCTLVFVYGQMIQNDKFKLRNKQLKKIWLGIIGGFFGSVLIVFGMDFPYGLVIDYRNIALTLAAMLGGELAVILAGIIIGLFRTFSNGVSFASVIGGMSVLCSLIGCVIILKFKMGRRKKWSLLFGYSTLCTIIAIALILRKQPEVLLESAGSFIMVSMIGGYIAYVLYGYLMEVQGMYKRLKEEVENDYLTGLKNKKKFSESMEELFKQLKEKDFSIAIIMFDIDHFKLINDTYGHLAGDAVLKQLGMLAKENNKECEHCMGAFRIGGEEFAIITVDHMLEVVVKRAEYLRTVVEQNTFLLPTGEQIQITISIGVSLYPYPTNSPYDLVEEADEALYISKETGRNKVSFKNEDNKMVEKADNKVANT